MGKDKSKVKRLQRSAKLSSNHSKRLPEGRDSSLTEAVRSENDVNNQVSLHDRLLRKDLMTTLRRSWMNKKKFPTDGLVSFDHLPFKHLSVKNLVKDDAFLLNLSAELQKLPYERMLNDLYSFYQTDDLFSLDRSCPSLEAFLSLLSGPVKSWVQNVTGKEFSDKITATASQYRFCDRLLCHDDNLADRSVAFIFYLCKGWHEKDGGSLDLYECDVDNQPRCVVKSVYPGFGSFVFFEVNKKSYHRVAEVLSSIKTRLSINGWFHGNPLSTQVCSKELKPKFHFPTELDFSFGRWISPCWLNPKIHKKVQKTFRTELSIALPTFLKPKMYKEMEDAFKHSSIVWERCGPANRKCYDVACETTLPAVIQEFLDVIRSKSWYYFLTELTVDFHPEMKIKPKCSFEVQRWQPGDYTLLVDRDHHSSITGVDFHLYFNLLPQAENVEGGEIHYLGPEKDEKGFLEEGVQVEPQSNTATLVVRITGMNAVTKYIDHRHSAPFHKIVATFSQG